MKINELIHQQEGHRVEFKEFLPKGSDLDKKDYKQD